MDARCETLLNLLKNQRYHITYIIFDSSTPFYVCCLYSLMFHFVLPYNCGRNCLRPDYEYTLKLRYSGMLVELRMCFACKTNSVTSKIFRRIELTHFTDETLIDVLYGCSWHELGYYISHDSNIVTFIYAYILRMKLALKQ